MKMFLHIFILAVHLVSVLSTPLSSVEIIRCWVSDEACLTAQVQSLVTNITDGIPELGIERTDPMLIDSLKIENENFKFFMKDIEVKGLRDSIVDSVSVNPATNIVRMVYHTSIYVTSKYELDGYLFSMPVKGGGDLKFKQENVEIEVLMTFDIIKDVHHRDIMDLKEFHSTRNIKGDVDYKIGNLYYGDKDASDKMHELIHQNADFLQTAYGSYFWNILGSKLFDGLKAFMHSRALNTILTM